MKVPRDLTGNDVSRALKRLGFRFIRQRGSHLVFRKDEKVAIVPDHDPIRIGTLMNVLKMADITLEELLDNV
jgi:predicted RNA binding protein YcfA (HicA-like mRNA interferase family)